MHSPIVFFALSLIIATEHVTAAPARSKALAGACSDMIIIFAKGTFEPGLTGAVIGPALEASVALALAPQSVTVLGLPATAYPADVPGFLVGGSASGSKMMAQMATEQTDKCPDAQIVISGYSQGGQLVHNAAKMIPSEKSAKMKAVIFGDPMNGDPVAGVPAASTLVICRAGDNICDHGNMILPPHMAYGADASTAADFLAGKGVAANKAAKVGQSKAGQGKAGQSKAGAVPKPSAALKAGVPKPSAALKAAPNAGKALKAAVPKAAKPRTT